MARILLGVSGGIAAYKALELVRLADAAGHSVRVVQTPASRHFVGEASFAALTGAPVLTSEFQPDPAHGAFPGQRPPAHRPLSHLELVGNADLYVIAPASANTIAKLAHGLADNLLTSAALACRCPLLIAPAMNDAMYEHPATRANIELLEARGALVIAPGIGRLASRGEEGIGRLAEPAEILAACERALRGPMGDGVARGGGEDSWRGLVVLVSAGGTREPIDAVRYVGNRSSGRMGVALAAAARRRGADVVLVGANLAVPAPAGVRCVPVATAAELGAACERELARADVVLMAAAVADFRPRAPVDGKIKKDGRTGFALELEPTQDVLSALAARRRAGQTIVGFAAEHGAGGDGEARRKLVEKGLDAVVLNDVSQPGLGFDSEENEVRVLSAAAERHLARAKKAAIAEGILDFVAHMRSRAVPAATDGRAPAPTVDVDVP